MREDVSHRGMTGSSSLLLPREPGTRGFASKSPGGEGESEMHTCQGEEWAWRQLLPPVHPNPSPEHQR